MRKKKLTDEVMQTIEVLLLSVKMLYTLLHAVKIHLSCFINTVISFCFLIDLHINLNIHDKKPLITCRRKKTINA